MGRVNRKLARAPPSLSKTAGLSLKGVSRFIETKTDGEEPTPADSVLKLEAAEAVVEVDSAHKQPIRMTATTNRSIGKMKKKDRMKMKKDLLRKKLAAIHGAKEEAKNKKKRQKTVIVGDMKPLSDGLKVIDDLLKEDQKKKEKVKVKKDSGRVKKQKQRKEQFMKDVGFFKQVYSHPDYNKDYMNTISTHIENKMIAEVQNG